MSKKNEFSGLFQAIMLGHLILVLHILVLAGMGVLIIFFRGLVTYMPLILVAGLTLLAAAAYYVFRHLKRRGIGLKEIMDTPALSGKCIEIKLLGDMASIKIDSHGGNRSLPAAKPALHAPLQEAQKPARVIELPELTRDIERDPIHPGVHNTAKRKFFKWKN